ncbi:MAG: pyruvate dehydrogenase (acetyl-transferring) E1 component subunit alpha [Candidatus Micrarchaeia archaeon]|jgi:pyruvate dehydrogenase E1 component alpha subunit
MVRKKVFEGSVEYVQVLDEQGIADKELEPQLTNEELDGMYRAMVLVREFDRKAMSVQRQGRIFTYLPVEGQEGAQIGIAMATKKDDRMFPSYREHGIAIARGADLKDKFIACMGVEERIPKESGDFTVAIPIGSQTIHAVGAAMAAQIKKEGHACVTFFGDGASSEGELHEAMNLAGVNKAPVVFICQNNLYAISVPRKIQTAAATIAQRALGYGFEGIQVDGNDVLGAYVIAKYALEKARAGGGPTVMECLTYRFGPHSTSDDPSKYRSKEEEAEWRKKDPFVRFQAYLKAKGVWSEEFEQRVVADAKAQVEKAFAQAEAEIKVDPQDIFKYVFEEMPDTLKEQMDYMLKVEEEKKKGKA